MIIGLDVDGVVQDTYAYILRELGLPADAITHYKLQDSFKRGEAKLIRQMFGDPRTVVGAPPVEGAVEALKTLVGGGHSIYFITGLQDKGHMPLREWWLTATFPFVAARKHYNLFHATSENKPRIAWALGCEVFVEDRRATANAFAEEGVRSILVPSSYHADGPIHAGVEVMTLGQFAESL